MFEKIKKWLHYYQMDPETKDLKFSKPDDDGVIYLLDDAGNETTIGLQTYDSDLVRLAQLVNTGISFNQAQKILKQEKRSRKLKDLLK
jgi:hypothetical protein